jgi:hypothetical protein
VLGAERLAARLPSRPPFRAQLAPALLCAASVVASALAGGLPWSRDFHARDFRPGPDSAARWRVLSAIAPGASVQAPDGLLPHLVERARVFRSPPPERSADLVVLDASHRRLFAHREDLLRTAQEPNLRRWLARSDHQLVRAAGDLLLLQRGRPPREGLVRRYFAGQAPVGAGKRLCACLELLGAELGPRALTLDLVARAPCPSDLALRLGSDERPRRVDLLFDGLLSPAHLLAGDHLRSRHLLSADERAEIERRGLRVGALRSSGARPEPSDPTSVRVQLRAAPR